MALSGMEAVILLESSGFKLRKISKDNHRHYKRGEFTIMVSPLKSSLDSATEHRIRKLCSGSAGSRDLVRAASQRKIEMPTGVVGAYSISLKEEEETMLEPQAVEPTTTKPIGLLNKFVELELECDLEYEELLKFKERYDAYLKVESLAKELGITVKDLPFTVIGEEEVVRLPHRPTEAYPVSYVPDGSEQINARPKWNKILEYVRKHPTGVTRTQISQKCTPLRKGDEDIESLVNGGWIREEQIRGSRGLVKWYYPK